MGEELDSTQKQKRKSIVRELAEKFDMPEKEVKEYIGIFQKMFDNILFMGIKVEMEGVLRVEQEIPAGRREKVAWNKLYVSELVNGKYKKVYVCKKYPERRAQAKGNVIKN